MANLTKSFSVALAHQAVTHPNTVVGSALDVSTKLAATLLLFHASVEAAANTNPGRFIVQASGAATGNDDWVDLAIFDATISTADTEAMTATEAVGVKVLAVAATAGFVAKDKLYIQDASVVADGEWGICQEIVTDTSIDLVDGLTNEKDSSDVIWNDADLFTCQLDLTSISRIRVLFIHEGTAGVNCHIKVMANFGDEIG